MTHEEYDPEWYNKLLYKKERLQFKMWVVMIILAISFGVWWEIYRYHDCRRIGHTVLYCVFSK